MNHLLTVQKLTSHVSPPSTNFRLQCEHSNSVLKMTVSIHPSLISPSSPPTGGGTRRDGWRDDEGRMEGRGGRERYRRGQGGRSGASGKYRGNGGWSRGVGWKKRG